MGKQSLKKAGLKRKQAAEEAAKGDVVRNEPNMATSSPQKRRKSATDGIEYHQSNARIGKALEKRLVTAMGVLTTEKELEKAAREAAYPNLTVEVQKVTEAMQKLTKTQTVHEKQWKKVMGLYAVV